MPNFANVDGSEPTLERVGSWPEYPSGPALDVALLDQYAYVTIGFGGILILDISSPSFPKRVGHVDEVGYANLLEIHDGRLYVGTFVVPVTARTDIGFLQKLPPEFQYDLQEH